MAASSTSPHTPHDRYISRCHIQLCARGVDFSGAIPAKSGDRDDVLHGVCRKPMGRPTDQLGPSVELEIIAPTPRCAVPLLSNGALPASPAAVGAVNKLNRVEFPLLGPGRFPCLGAYATVLSSGSIHRGRPGASRMRTSLFGVKPTRGP